MFANPEEDIELMDIIPHVRRAMAFKAISNKFSMLAGVTSNMNKILKSTSMLSNIQVERSLEGAVETGKQILQVNGTPASDRTYCFTRGINPDIPYVYHPQLFRRLMHSTSI